MRDGWQAEAGLDLADPAPDRNIAIHVKSAFMRNARVGRERDIGEREGAADKEAALAEMAFKMIERRIAALHLLRIELGCLLAEIGHLKAADRNVGLVAVLLPEQPFIHLGGRKVFLGDEIA